MKKKIIIINGAGIGKYKFIKKLKKQRELNVFSTVSKIKELAKEIGWDGKTLNDKERQLICDLKDAYTKYNNGPVLDIIKDIENSDKELNIVLSREKKDNDQLKKYFGKNIKVVLFSRVGASQKDHKNHADRGIYGYKYDEVFLMFENLIEINMNDLLKIIDEI